MSNAVFNNSKLLSRVKGVVEVGASIGEELPEWEKNKIPNQIFIEPISELFSILESKASQQSHHPAVQCFNLALSDFDGESDFHLSTGSMCSSSLLEFSKDAVRYGLTMQTSETRKVQVRKLDTLIEEQKIDLKNYNLLFIDVQGTEYKLIQGAQKSLSAFDFIFCEVNFVPLYQEITLWEDFKYTVTEKGFNLIDVRKLENSNNTQGEALFFRKGLQW